MNKKEIIACVVAPIIAPVVCWLLVFSTGNNPKGIEIADVFEILGLCILFGAPVSYFSTLLFFVPLYKMLKRHDKDSIYTLTIGGAIIGAVMFIAFLFAMGASIDSLKGGSEIAKLSLSGAAMGGAVGFCFAIIR